MTVCACGCGSPVRPGNRFIQYHHPRRGRKRQWESYPAPIPDGECLRWQGPHHSAGYGLCGDRNGDGPYAHRVAWIRANGPIPPDLTIDHVVARGCRFKDCVNVAHLEPVTAGENARRGGAAPRIHGQSKKTHCRNGHEYTEENTAWVTRKRAGRKDAQERHCRACMNEWKRAKRKGDAP